MFKVETQEELKKLWDNGISRTILPCGVASQNSAGSDIFTVNEGDSFHSACFNLRESKTPGYDQELQAWSKSLGALTWFPIQLR